MNNLSSLKPQYKKLVLIYIIVLVAFLASVLVQPDLLSTPLLIISGLVLILFALGLVFLKLFFQATTNEKRILDTYMQTEALIQLNTLVHPKLPFPSTGDWAATADFIREILVGILTYKPKVIVEIGSGVSSLYIGQLIKEHGLDCTLYSLESSGEFAEVSAKNIKDHGLEAQVKLCYSEITKHTINGKEWLWYDTSVLENLASIDMLLVDGPSMLLQKYARYPAIPLLHDKLNQNAVILVDDYFRNDETVMVERWKKEFDLQVIKKIYNVKGFTLLQKK